MEEIIGYARNRGRPIFLIEEAAGKVEAREVKAGVDEDAARPDDVRLARLFGDAPPAAQVPAELERYFHACDDQAARQAPRVRSYLLNIVLANATASLAGSVSGAFPQTPASGTFLTLIKFTCILAGLIIFGVMRYRQSQGRWLGLRLRAEICRSALATWRCPRLVPFGPAEEVTELRELIQSIRYFRARHRPRREATLEEFKSDYGVRRLGEQYEYFRSQAARAHRVSSRFGPAYWILSSLSLATATGAVIWQSVLHFPLLPGTAVNFFFAFIPAIGPALASWVMAFQAIQSVGRRQGRFGEMQHLTRQAMLDLARCSTWAAALPVVERAEKMLLNEVTEWYLVSKYGK
jgi:hypothetical protein